jgi:fucose 4-O-acetylase-like acetyltransferase
MEQTAQLSVKKKRIEYIDAMRGFTMILVVFSHICVYGYGKEAVDDMVSFKNVFISFHMPLFFFISGWVLYKTERVWNWNFIKGFLTSKFMMLMVPTVFFFLLYVLVFKDARITAEDLNVAKDGYWFTLALFEFFLLYSLTLFFYPLKDKGWKEDIFVVAIALWVYVLASPRKFHQEILGDWYAYLGIYNLRFYLFFCLGTLVRKYYARFNRLMDNGYIMALVLFLFFGVAIFKEQLLALPNFSTLVFVAYGGLGTLVVLSFFWKHEASFTQETFLGRNLQLIGRRTLDVYLMHYLFLPRHLSFIGDFFLDNPNPTLELFLSGVLALGVIFLTLVVSEILRLSPFLGHWLFGVKEKK